MANAVLERLAAERDRINEQIDEVLANVEADERDPSDAEQQLIERQRGRLDEIEPQIVRMLDLEEQRASQRDAHGVITRASTTTASGDDRGGTSSGQGGGGQLQVIHRTAGEFIVDHLRARGGMADSNGLQLAPDPTSIERMAAWLSRIQHQTTADTPGLLPEPIIGDILNQKQAVQPFITSIGGARPMGGIPGKTFSRPKITQHALVGEQSGEKQELPSRQMTIGSVPFTKTTRGGTVNISRQDIDWTVPSAWDILLRDLAAAYGEDVEDLVAAGAAGAATASEITVGDNSLEGWATALYLAAAEVFNNTTPRRLPNRIWMSIDTWAAVGPIIDVAVIQAGNMLEGLLSSQGISWFQGNMFAVPRIVVPGFPAGTVIVGIESAYEVYEEVIGVLSAVEPALLGVQVAYGGYIAHAAVEPAGLVKISGPGAGG